MILATAAIVGLVGLNLYFCLSVQSELNRIQIELGKLKDEQ